MWYNEKVYNYVKEVSMEKTKKIIAMSLLLIAVIGYFTILPTNVFATNEATMQLQQTPTNEKNQEIDVKLKANIEENKTVYTGQIVKFTATVTNTSLVAKNNVKITIPVPEGTKYVTYDSTIQEYETKEEKEVKIALGNLAVGKTTSYSYELKMQPNKLGNFSHKVSVMVDGIQTSFVSNEYHLKKEQAKLILTNTVPTDPNYEIHQGTTLWATTTIEPMENLQNVTVTVAIPKGIAVKGAFYRDSSGKDSKTGITIKENQVTVVIPSLEAGTIQGITLKLSVDDFQGEFPLITTAVAEGMPMHTSNVLTYKVAIPKLEITQTSKTSNNVKETEKIVYEFTIKNVGNCDANNVVFQNILSEGLSFEKLEYSYQGKKTQINSSFHNTATVRWSSFAKEATCHITVTAKANILEGKMQKEVTSIATLEAKGLPKVNSNVITNTVIANKALYENQNNTQNQSQEVTYPNQTKSNMNQNTKNNNQTTENIMQEKKFDLSLKQSIHKITLTTPTIGTRATTYTNKSLAKVEVLNRNVNKSNVVIEYKITVTNEGTIPGYVKKIVNYLPEDAKFNSELNPAWYVAEGSQTVYNTSLANTLLKPGESKELTLVLSIQITDKTIGVIATNTAEIVESTNEYGLPDTDSVANNQNRQEDDMAMTEIVFAIVTGKIVQFIWLPITVLLLLSIGTYEIKRKV